MLSLHLLSVKLLVSKPQAKATLSVRTLEYQVCNGMTLMALVAC